MFNLKNINSEVAATGLVSLDPNRMIAWLEVEVRTPSSLLALEQPSLTLSFKTPSNIIELNCLIYDSKKEKTQQIERFSKLSEAAKW